MVKFVIFIILALSIAASRALSQFNSENPCGDDITTHFAPNPRGCSWWWSCQNGQPVHQGRCETGLHFNPKNRSCDHAESVNCDFDDRHVDLFCPPDRYNVHMIPHPYSCTKYTVCFDGAQNDRDCPLGLHYSDFDKGCVSPFLADCNLDFFTCKQPLESNLPVFVPDSRDCRAYYSCSPSCDKATPLRCAPGQHFNLEEGWCTPPEVANCTPVIPENTPRIPDQTTINCDGHTGPLSHPESCYFYFFCFLNQSFMQFCGNDFRFDMLLLRCVRSENAKCHLDVDVVPMIGQ